MEDSFLLESMKDFMDMEYRSTVISLRYRTTKGHEIHIEDINAPLQRCLGVAQFTQTLGLPFKSVDAVYQTYKELFEQLRNKYL